MRGEAEANAKHEAEGEVDVEDMEGDPVLDRILRVYGSVVSIQRGMPEFAQATGEVSV